MMERDFAANRIERLIAIVSDLPDEIFNRRSVRRAIYRASDTPAMYLAIDIERSPRKIFARRQSPSFCSIDAASCLIARLVVTGSAGSNSIDLIFREGIPADRVGASSSSSDVSAECVPRDAEN